MRSHDTISDLKMGWFMGKDDYSQIKWREDWKKLAREDIEFEPLEELKEDYENRK